MKRLITGLLISCLLVICGSFSGGKALAFRVNPPTGTASGSNVGVCSGSSASSPYCGETQNPTDKITGSTGLIATIINIASLVAGVLAIILILIASIKFMTSSGEPNSVKSARAMLIYTFIGLVVLALAQVIVRFVIGNAP